MPKLIIMAACEKVIIDRQQLPSLISIFQRMNIQLQEAPLPEKAISPLRWAVFTLWQHEPEERGVEYIQHTEILTPTGEQFAGNLTTKFRITEEHDLQSKNHIELFGLPIYEEGFVTVRVWLEGIPDCAGEYKFLVKHQMPSKSETSLPVQDKLS